MNTLLKLEEFATFVLGIYLFSLLGFDWWIMAVLFFTPDLGMLGYLFGKKTGGITYNIFHHKGVAVGLYLLGVFQNEPWVQLIGTVIYAHAAFDRMFNYGLKYQKGFKYTHLGRIGRS